MQSFLKAKKLSIDVIIYFDEEILHTAGAINIREGSLPSSSGRPPIAAARIAESELC